MKNDWNSEYVTEIDYTSKYYAEINPFLVKFAFTNAGVFAPEINNACELGFGKGLSININASASTVAWSGTDFMPSQAGFAKELSLLSGNNAKLFDESFAQYCTRTDLPDFDYIGLHGIWSWISDENRRIIVDFIDRKLKVGGVLYVSYNTQPGWSAMKPIRDLMMQHKNTMCAPSEGILKQVNGTLDFIEQLLALNPIYVAANPTIIKLLSELKNHDRTYVAHEYFNQHLYPFNFHEITNWLSSAKLSYVCSANLLSNISVLNLSTDQQAFLDAIPNITLRECTRDVILNTKFRKDYWVKGKRNLSPFEKIEVLMNQKLILITDKDQVELKLNCAIGTANLNEKVYVPIIDKLNNHKPKLTSELIAELKDQNISVEQMIQAITVLFGQGVLSVVQEEIKIKKTKNTSEKLNKAIMLKSRSTSELNYLASPLTGGGIGVGRIAQLFLLAIEDGNKTPLEWANYTWNLLSVQGHKLLKGGMVLETSDENLAELTEQAYIFEQRQLPILRALQIANK